MKKTTFRITFEDGETRSASLMPILPAKYIATVTPSPIDPTKFTGEYGIDWCEMDTNFSKIVKFQNTPVSDISHILDEPSSQFIKGGTDPQKQAILKEMYEIVQYCGKDYPVTWINLPKGKVATINIKTALISGKDEKTDFLTIAKNPNFEISYGKTSDAGSNPPIKLDKLKKKGTAIEIKALNTFTQKEYISIQDYNGDEVGKIEMAPNNIETLAVKIIPVVFKSNTSTERTDAQALYKKATNGTTLLDSLNNKAFSQVGIQCAIAPVQPNPECVVIDITKDNWAQFYKKGIFQDWDYKPVDVVKPTVSLDEDGNKRYHTKDITYSRFLVDQLEDTYFAKYGKTHKGALIFVTDKNYIDPNFIGFSQANPIRSQGTVIFNNGLSDTSVFAHEIGHMLGLEHTFFKDVTEMTDTNDKLDKLTRSQSVVDGKKEINDLIAHQENYLKERISLLQKAKSKNNPTSQELLEIKRLEEDITTTKKSITKQKDKLRKIDINRVSGLKVTQAKTKNYMDYINDRTYFAKHQAEQAKKECKDFYK